MIQWFPGHMNKALRVMGENISLCQCVGYVLDARAPYSCLNPQFNKLFANKPTVFILNKCDLADKQIVDKWLSFFKERGHPCIALSSINSAEKNKLQATFLNACQEFTNTCKARGIIRPVRVMILGVPNSGKSTLINCLSARKATVTGDKPGVTKGKQWVRLDNGLELLDTPGTLWPKFDDELTGKHLFFIGSIKEEIVDIVTLAQDLLAELAQLYSSLLIERYKLTELLSPEETLKQICIKRGYLLSGNIPDLERGAKAIIDDFRKAKIGRICLEQPKQKL
ncbi:MAG: ribosome biogenesis GTPase YlqF [Clostridia bacterium]